MSGKGLNGKKIIKIAIAAVLVLAVVFAALYVKSLLDNAPDLVPYNGSNTNNAADVPEPSPGSNTVPELSKPDPVPTPVPQTDPEPSGPVYYTEADLKKLKNTDVFNKSAIEHIFLGTVNSSGKGSGYHYDMIKDSPGKILEETRSKTDKNGCYTAYVEVNGREKEHYSTFYPDDCAVFIKAGFTAGILYNLITERFEGEQCLCVVLNEHIVGYRSVQIQFIFHRL